jgi:glycosyltransferase involved in cell wall biosynthesis
MNRGVLSRNGWFYRELPPLVARIRPDVLHLTYPVPLDRRSTGIPTVVTLHDLYPFDIPENFGLPKGFFNRFVLRQCLRNADAIACVSDTTLDRMKQHLPRELWDKALRIHNCVEPVFKCASHAPLPVLEDGRFLLSVAQHRSNKNIPLLIEAFQYLAKHSRLSAETKLLIIGIRGPETSLIQRLISRPELAGRVHLLEGLTDAELQWCYRNCELLVAPSRIEGFGLPVAEALLAGCRVICSDIPAFREIDETHCNFVRLGSRAAENLASNIVIALQQARPNSIELPKFSAQVVGAQYMGLYRRLSRADEIPSYTRRMSHRRLTPGEAGATFYRQTGEERDGL